MKRRQVLMSDNVFRLFQKIRHSRLLPFNFGVTPSSSPPQIAFETAMGCLAQAGRCKFFVTLFSSPSKKAPLVPPPLEFFVTVSSSPFFPEIHGEGGRGKIPGKSKKGPTCVKTTH